jgi:hypothetical protein
MTSALRWFSDYHDTRDSRRAIRQVRILEYEELEPFFFNGQSDRPGAAQSSLLDWLVCRLCLDSSQQVLLDRRGVGMTQPVHRVEFESILVDLAAADTEHRNPVCFMYSSEDGGKIRYG